jgi:hypothetical protein
MAVPNWYRQTWQNFQAQGVNPQYWLGVAIAENNSFNVNATNTQGEYSVGPWQYNFQGGLGQSWMNAMNWSRTVAEQIFRNPQTASSYVAVDMQRALARSGGDYREFLRQSGHPGNVPTSDLFDRFGAIYQDIPTGMEASYNWLINNGYLSTQASAQLEQGGSNYIPVAVKPGTGGWPVLPGPGEIPGTIGGAGNAIENAIGQIAQNIRQGIEAAIATLVNRAGVKLGEFWAESWPALLLLLIAIVLLLIGIIGIVLRYIFPASNSVNRIISGVNAIRSRQ